MNYQLRNAEEQRRRDNNNHDEDGRHAAQQQMRQQVAPQEQEERPPARQEDEERLRPQEQERRPVPPQQQQQQQRPNMLGLQNPANPIFPTIMSANRYGSVANLLAMKLRHRHPDANATKIQFASGNDARTWCGLKKIYQRITFYSRRDGTSPEEAAETLDREREAAGESLSKFIKSLRAMGYKKGTRNRNRN